MQPIGQGFYDTLPVQVCSQPYVNRPRVITCNDPIPEDHPAIPCAINMFRNLLGEEECNITLTESQVSILSRRDFIHADLRWFQSK